MGTPEHRLTLYIQSQVAGTLQETQNRLKPKFLARWSVKGRTQYALYGEWQSLYFDPRKDDIEEFMTDIKNIASQLNCPDAAQVMVIKGVLPIEIYNTCLKCPE